MLAATDANPLRLTAAVPFGLTPGAVELLKWIALASMVVDHANAYMFDSASVLAQAFGRLAFPLFGFVLAYNLARSEPPRLAVAAQRLAVAGVVAQPFYALMVGTPWRLNVMFTFLAALGIIALVRQAPTTQRYLAAAALFLLGGFVVDFYWYGIAFVVAAYFFSRLRNIGGLAVLCGALTMLSLVLVLMLGAAGVAGVLAVPLTWAVRDAAPTIRRLPWLFYVFYPVHMAVLVLGAIMLRST